MTREEILKASTAQINEWIDETIMKDRKHYAGDWPKWSSDIAAAWEVVEKMQQRFLVSLYANPNNVLGERYTVHISKTAMGSNFVEVNALTAPEAICRAALMAVMEAEI